MHLQQPADTLALVAADVEHLGTAFQPSRIDPDESQLSHVRIGHDFEDQGGEGSLVVGRPLFLGAAARDDPGDRRHVQRRRQVIHHRIQELLHPLVLERRPAQDQGEMQRLRASPQGRFQLGLVQLLAGKVAGEQLVALLAGGLHQLFPRGIRLFLELGGDGDFLELLVGAARFPAVGLHPEKIDDPLEVFLFSQRNLNRDRPGVELGHHHPDATIEVGALPVHLVHEGDTRDLVLVRLPPHRL